MPTNKNAIIRYQALDRCFSDFLHRYYMEDLIEACAEALYQYTGYDLSLIHISEPTRPY